VPHLLDGVAAKFTRANLHAHAFREAARGQIQGIDLTVDLDPHATEHVETVWWTIQHPWFAPVFGDAVHNYRSTLDHLVAGLTRSHGHKPGSRASFPIFDKPPASVSDPCFRPIELLHSILRPLNWAERAVMLRVQPYRSSDADSHPLMRLQRLDNADKHHSLLAANNAPLDFGFEIRAARDCEIVGVTRRAPGLFEIGAELGRIGYRVTGPKPQIDMTSRMTPQIVLAGTGEDPDQLLAEIRDFILQKILKPLIPDLYRISGDFFIGRPPVVPADRPSDPF
jgi:hypothetical protein